MNQPTDRLIAGRPAGSPHLDVKHLRDLLPPTYAQSYGSLLLGRPMLVGHDEITRFATDLVALYAVLTSLPGRCFDGDRGRFGAAMGIDERLLRIMLLGVGGEAPPLYARADAFHDGHSFQLLELNVGSELGGIDAAQLNRAFLAEESFRAFAQRRQLSYVDTCGLLAGLLRAAARPVTSAEPVVALVEARAALAEHGHVFVALQEAMRGHGVDLLLGEIDQIGSRDGKLTLAGKPLDVVLRYFATDQLTTAADEVQLEMVMRAHADGATVLFTPLGEALWASKASLGMLYEPRVQRVLTADERALVQRVVPFTRMVGGAAGALTGAEWDQLVATCREQRESLVLKPGLGYGGVGVVLGREVSDREWHEHLLRVRSLDYVAQRVVRPASEPVLAPETGELEDWHANWGIFVTEDGYGGAFVRALRPGDGSVISYSNPGTRGTCVFTYPSDPPGTLAAGPVG